MLVTCTDGETCKGPDDGDFLTVKIQQPPIF